MIFRVVSVRDSAVDMFTRPFFARSANEALRIFGDEVRRPDSPMGAHPEHYELYELGHWDDSTADFRCHAKPISLMLASEAIKGV